MAFGAPCFFHRTKDNFSKYISYLRAFSSEILFLSPPFLVVSPPILVLSPPRHFLRVASAKPGENRSFLFEGVLFLPPGFPFFSPGAQFRKTNAFRNPEIPARFQLESKFSNGSTHGGALTPSNTCRHPADLLRAKCRPHLSAQTAAGPPSRPSVVEERQRTEESGASTAQREVQMQWGKTCKLDVQQFDRKYS